MTPQSSLNLEQSLRNPAEVSGMCPPRFAQISLPSWLTLVLGLVLLVAAGLKGHQLLTGYIPGKTLLTSRAFQILIVEVELGLGLWLTTGFYKQLARFTALIYFIILAGTSAYLVTIGQECCGCLGRLAINPWVTFGFNMFALCALALCPFPGSTPKKLTSRPYLATCAILVFCVLGMFVLVASPAPQTVNSLVQDFGDDGEVVILELENWKGHRLPHLEHLDIYQQIVEGTWVLIFYRGDCAMCEELLKSVDSVAKPSARLVALIEVPSFGGSYTGASTKPGDGIVYGRLATTRRWVIETPTILDLENGIINQVQVRSGNHPEQGTKKEVFP